MGYKIKHDRPNCIGCGACAAVCEKFWEMDEDGKSNIVGGKKMPDGTEELEIEDKDFEENQEAAEVCPVNVIHLYNDKGEKLI